MDFFIDPTATIYAVLGACTVVTGFAAYQSPKRIPIGLFLVALAVLLAVAVTDYFIESPREEVVRKLDELAAAARDGDFDRMVEHISKDFKTTKSLPRVGVLTKEALKEKARTYERYAKTLRIASTPRETVRYNEDRTEVTLGVKVVVSERPVTGVITFRKEEDGEYRAVRGEFKVGLF